MRRVLYITTSDGSFTLMKELMADATVDVLQIRTGVLALNALGSSRGQTVPDLLLVDWNLAVMTAIEFAAAARALPLMKAVPIIVLSEDLPLRQLTATYAAGVNAVVMQPASLDEATELCAVLKAFWLGDALLPCLQKPATTALSAAQSDNVSRKAVASY